MKSVLTVAFLLIAQLAVANEVQFRGGNDIKEITMEGVVDVRCNNRRNTYSCRESFLSSGDMSPLFTTEAVNADSVRVVNARNKRSKKVKYKASNKMSSRINLWIDTLFQRSLLERGDNEIFYEFLKKKNVVESGSFNVNVSRGERRICNRGSLWYSGNNCPSSISACDSYFRRYNYCK